MTQTPMSVATSNNGWRHFAQILTRDLRSRGNLLILTQCVGQLSLQAVEQRARD